MSEPPACWKCMKRSVLHPGELCMVCLAAGAAVFHDPGAFRPGKRVKPLEEWTLEELIATQEAGDVPGQSQWEDNETAVGYGIANFTS